MSAIVLTIPAASPSQNETDRLHWTKRRKLKAQWHYYLQWGAVIAQAPKASGKRKVHIARHGKRELDPSNIVGGAKGIIDALVQLKLLVDDSPKWVEVTAANGPYDKKVGVQTVITLVDA